MNSEASERHHDDLLARYLAAIVDSSDDAIVSKDLNGVVKSWNAGAQRIFGYLAEEIVGSSILRIIPPERHQEEEVILSRLRKGERIDHFETERLTKDGRLVAISLTVSPIKNAQGEVVGVSKIARDITEQKRTLRELQRAKDAAETASRMKDEFLATLSHELRTPLNAIMGWADLLLSGPTDLDEVQRGLEVIHRNARAQSQIINDLLDMSRIISGKVKLEVKAVDLPGVIMQAIETVKVAAQGKNIRIQTVLNEFAGIVPGDESRLQQVIWNLLNNAIKFTPKGGKVQIFLDRVNSHIELKVVDNGEGISPEMLPQIFERFKQADASTTRQHGGLGLGLSIVKQLVELHGGHVTASSGGKGQGAVFIVNLPVMAVDWRPDVNTVSAANLLKSEAAESNQKLPGVYILAVDDDADARHLIKMLLERAGCVVETASSAQEAMKKVSIFKPHILICDIGMPEEDGYSMIQRLRETDVGRDLPAISLTAYARGEDRIKALRHGFNHHLAKPINPQELIAVLSSLMERYPGSVSDSGPSRN